MFNYLAVFPHRVGVAESTQIIFTETETYLFKCLNRFIILSQGASEVLKAAMRDFCHT